MEDEPRNWRPKKKNRMYHDELKEGTTSKMLPKLDSTGNPV